MSSYPPFDRDEYAQQAGANRRIDDLLRRFNERGIPCAVARMLESHEAVDGDGEEIPWGEGGTFVTNAPRVFSYRADAADPFPGLQWHLTGTYFSIWDCRLTGAGTFGTATPSGQHFIRGPLTAAQVGGGVTFNPFGPQGTNYMDAALMPAWVRELGLSVSGFNLHIVSALDDPLPPGSGCRFFYTGPLGTTLLLNHLLVRISEHLE